MDSERKWRTVKSSFNWHCTLWSQWVYLMWTLWRKNTLNLIAIQAVYWMDLAYNFTATLMQMYLQSPEFTTSNILLWTILFSKTFTAQYAYNIVHFLRQAVFTITDPSFLHQGANCFKKQTHNQHRRHKFFYNADMCSASQNANVIEFSTNVTLQMPQSLKNLSCHCKAFHGFHIEIKKLMEKRYVQPNIRGVCNYPFAWNGRSLQLYPVWRIIYFALIPGHTSFSAKN